MLENNNIYNNGINFNSNTNINTGTNFSSNSSNASGLLHKFSGCFGSTPSNQLMNGNTSMLSNNDDITLSMTNWPGIDSTTVNLFFF